MTFSAWHRRWLSSDLVAELTAAIIPSWVALSLVDLGLSAGTAASLWYVPFLDPLAKLGAWATATLLTLPLVAIVLTPVVWFARRLRQRPAARPAWIGLAFALGVVLSAYFASWTVFRDTGQFFDRFAYQLSRASPGSMFQHAFSMRPLETLLGPSVALVLAALLCWHLRRPPSEASRRWWLSQGRRLLWLLVLLAAQGWLLTGRSGRAHLDLTKGILLREADLYRAARDDQANPAAHAWADLRRIWRDGGDPRSVWLRSGIWETPLPANLQRPRQVPLRDYTDRVDTATMHRWNVIVLLIESLRPDQLQSFGGCHPVMPCLDRLAAESLCFLNTYAQASHSNYADMCPLSSHYPLRTPDMHFYPRRPPYPRVLFYDILDALGYRTAIFSSQNERWGRMLNYLDTGNLDRLLHAETYQGPTYLPEEDIGFSTWAAAGKRCGKIDDRWTVKAAAQWIRQDPDRPFAIYMNLQNSHIPYVVPSTFPRRFSSGRLDFTIGFNAYPPERSDEVRDVYADALAYVDCQLEKLVTCLQETGQWDRTLLVVTGDTGQAFYEHGFAAHANELYNEVMRVPLIIRVPDRPHQRDDRLAQHIDVPTTICDLLNIPVHPSFQGRSLLEDRSQAAREAFLLVQTPLARQVATVCDSWKLIHDLPTNRLILYNLEHDPGERHDVADQHPDVVARLKRRLHAWCRAQLEYYADPIRQRTEYPPRFAR